MMPISIRTILSGLMMILIGGCIASPPVLSPASEALLDPNAPVYALKTFSLEGVGLPIALATDDDSNVWAVTEFGSELHHVADNPQVTIEKIDVPIRAKPGHYPYLSEEGQGSTRPLSERIITDSLGRLWFPQTGHWLNFSLPEDSRNYSRIVSYNPRSESYCIYPVPDSNSGVLGLAWDEARNLIWFTQSGNNALVAFNPDELRACDSYTNYKWRFDSEGNPVKPFPISYCGLPSERGCMRRYELDGKIGVLNQVVIQQPDDPDPGSVWMTQLAAHGIIRYDPDTGKQTSFPIPPAQYVSTYFSRLHQIHIHPVDGDLVFSANARGQIFRFDIQRYLIDGQRCTELDGSNHNPCMKSMRVPVFDKQNARITTHSMAFDRFHNLWVTTWAGSCPLHVSPPGLAVVNADWQHMIFLGQPRLFEGVAEEYADSSGAIAATVPCMENGRPRWAFKGVVVDAANNIWFTNYYARLLHKLELTGGNDLDPFPLLCEQCSPR
ncbi:MAG: hypothetical protein U5K56_09060 [Halioglobus sp.]|nr:hypothetical protein [Halioglobus sp.]